MAYSFVGFGRAPLSPPTSITAQGPSGVLAKLLKGKGKGVASLVNATYFSNLLEDMGVPPIEYEQWPEIVRP